MLKDLREAIDGARWPVALSLAIEAWRESRAPALADLVDAIARKCPAVATPKPKDTQAWWFRLARPYDPLVVHALVAHASLRITHTDVTWEVARARHRGGPGEKLFAAMFQALSPYGRTFHVNATDRLATMLAWPDDPRAATILGEWLVTAPVRWDSLEQGDGHVVFYQAVADRLVELCDLRLVPRLTECVESPRGATKALQRLQQVHARRVIDAAWEKPIPAKLAKAIEACTSAVGSPVTVDPRRDEQALWSEIAKRPTDLAVRSVLGDALIERGDPRGELFAIKKRELVTKLVNKHWNEWLGDLALVLNKKGTEFHAGMLEVVRVGTPKTPEWAFRKVHGHRELAAVHTVRPGHVRPEHYAAFLLGFDRLDRVAFDAPETIDFMAKHRGRWHIRAVEYGHDSVRDGYRYVFPPLEKTFATLARIVPDLAELRIAPLSWPEGAAQEVRQLRPKLASLFPALEKISIGRE